MGNPTTLQGWVAYGSAMGLNPLNYVPSSMYPDALVSVQRNIKSASNPPSAAQIAQGEACIVVRGLIYFKSVPGDCPSQSQLDFSGAEITQGVGGIASGIASLAGASLPGIGVAVQAISQIFEHHAQAVATEQQTICAVAGIINQVIPYYDNQVKIGVISPGTAKQGVQNFIAQVNGRLQSIYKKCNASCVYMSFLQAHVDFLNTYYPAIAPVGLFSHTPGAAPVTAYPTAPGGVIQVGGGATLSGSVSAGVPAGAETNYLPLAAIVIAALILILAVKG